MRENTIVQRSLLATRFMRENTIVQRSLLATRFMRERQKLLIKYSSKGASSIREFSVLHNLQFFAQTLSLKIGCVFN